MDTPTQITNKQFGDAVDLHFTMASRLRSGQRRPSLLTLRRIAVAYDLPMETLVQEYEKGRITEPGPWEGRYAIGRYLSENVFHDPELIDAPEEEAGDEPADNAV